MITTTGLSGSSLDIAANSLFPSCIGDIERSLDILCNALEAVTTDTHSKRDIQENVISDWMNKEKSWVSEVAALNDKIRILVRTFTFPSSQFYMYPNIIFYVPSPCSLSRTLSLSLSCTLSLSLSLSLSLHPFIILTFSAYLLLLLSRIIFPLFLISSSSLSPLFLVSSSSLRHLFHLSSFSLPHLFLISSSSRPHLFVISSTSLPSLFLFSSSSLPLLFLISSSSVTCRRRRFVKSMKQRWEHSGRLPSWAPK